MTWAQPDAPTAARQEGASVHARQLDIGAIERDHTNAMALVNEGLARRSQGDEDRALEDLRQAFELERRAAAGLLHVDLEPSRSILLCSAASLAVMVGENESALALAGEGLRGTPSRRIKKSLENIIGECNGRK